MDYTLSPEQIKRSDRSDYLHLLMTFPEQLGEARRIVADVSFGRPVKSVKLVVVAGMGGSAIGGDLLRTYLLEDLAWPLLVHRDYSLPPFVDAGTLVFLSSYSGNTEETLSAAERALQKKARMVAIASGGRLAELAAEKGFPLIRIPSGLPPRAALGYSFGALLESLVKLGLVADRTADVEETGRLLEHRRTEYEINKDGSDNPAKQLAAELFRRFPVLYAWGWRYQAVAARWRGQLAEVGKQLSSHHLLPEMNHNEIAGWQHPAEVLSRTIVILLRDCQEPSPIRRRLVLTGRSLASRTGRVREVWASGDSLLARLFSLVYLGDFVSYYLAALNGVDPTSIESIEHLKKQLANDVI
jgi:glucose/mannose-6-phosphate isomerase